jgi:glycosyltransferase involved in cell wall biosynthesis
MISVIVPVYNEEKVLSERAAGWSHLAEHAELIFVDGNSRDATAEIASRYGKVIG